jgi:nucleotide-binding universal stress UspA family protein
MENYQQFYDQSQDEAETYLKGLEGKFAKKNIKAETHVGIEPVVREIVETADNHDVDLVLIGSHGRSGIGRFFFGSIASGVLNRIEKPLMSILP